MSEAPAQVADRRRMARVKERPAGREMGRGGMVESQPNQRRGRPVRTRAPQVDLSDAEILERGLAAFSELGYEGASVRELAKRLGVSHNFINDRFGSKNNFWRAVVDHSLEDLLTPLTLAFEADADDAEKLELIVKAFYSIAVQVPETNRIIASEFTRNTERVDYIYSRYTGLFLVRLEPLADRLMESGRMPRISMDILFTALNGPALALTQTEVARRLGRAPDPSPAEWTQMIDSLVEVVLRGLLPARPRSDS
ncbi:TetR/AcrR family transcriptional regulator [Micromonospora musae]|uniref:TetR/AcrR family transcriptional regulator n=1 Tax=Micromonospora musae TaxID=1894970 RepID=UPI003427877A